MKRGKGPRIVQASPVDPIRAIESAWTLGCNTIAWDLRLDCEEAVQAASAARLRSEGWYSVARDPLAVGAHPEWMHPWGGEPTPVPQVIAPYLNLAQEEAFAFGRDQLVETVDGNQWCTKLWLGDIQGPPAACVCGDSCCRSLVDPLLPRTFFESVVQSIWDMDRALQVVPILCPASPCGSDQWLELLERFRSWTGSLFVPHVGLLLMREALGKEAGWPLLAHTDFGQDLFPCVEPDDASQFESCLVLQDAPQDVWPVPSPVGFRSISVR